MLNRVLILVLLSVTALAQAPQLKPVQTYAPLPAVHRAHHTRTWLITLGILAAGAVVGGEIALHQHDTCPKMINGYPYDGTPPCPNPATYDPGTRRR